jgi:flagellin-like protein
MKRIWRNKEGVSPVIATILMVAITVVLAAVLYVMVSGYMTGGGGTPASGSLTYLSGSSNPTEGNATFTLALNTPANPLVTEITITILDDNGDPVTTGTVASWSHLVTSADPTHVQGGDRLKLVSALGTPNIAGYEIVISFTGYSGTVTGSVPA